MRKRRKPSVLLAGSLLAGCGSPAQPEVHQNLVQRDPAAEALAALSRDALVHDRFARRTLYTWTTADQIEALRASKQLLVRDESPANGASYLDQVLYLLAQRGEPTATLLYTTAFAKMRFAWHAPWATRAGWPREQYGDQLIRVTLRADAVIVGLSSATGAFEARNLLDENVPLATVRAHPEKIAAIFFVSDASAEPAAGLPRPTASYREFALCNESMIESWEVGTDRIAKVLADDAAAIDALVRYLQTQPTDPVVPAPVAWAAGSPASPTAAYASALALDSLNYRLDATQLAALAVRLRATPRPRALEVVPTAAFAAGQVRTPPRIVRRYADTFATMPASPTAAKP